MNKTKQEISKFIMERYNPDKTFIEVELADIWDFFGITEDDILKTTLNTGFQNQEKKHAS